MKEALLSVSDLTVRFGDKAVVDGIGFSVRKGECVAIVGESGSGKSVSAHAVLRLLPKAAQVEGHITLDGIELASAPDDVLRDIRGNRISMIFQEPMTSLNPLHTVEAQVGEALLLHRRLSETARRQRVVELLTDVGIPDPESRLNAYPHQLSGGQRQRVMIAMALACEPALLIADEPTTALDVVVQSKIIDLLKSLQTRRGMALLIISHDLNVVRRVADRIYVMRQGQVVESGECAAILDAPAHPYTRMLVDAEPDGTALPATADAAMLLDVDSLRVDYRRGGGLFRRKTVFTALDDVGFTLRAGQTLGIVGESGSGKSTLGQAVLRLIPSAGRIAFEGERLDTLSSRAMRLRRKRLQIVFQDPFGSLSPHMSVAQIVGEGVREQARMPEAAIEDAVDQALRDVGLDPAMRHRFPHEFSGGQRQRIAIARALILRPDVIVMDEPTSALDRTVQKQVVLLLRELQARFGMAYLFISHDLAVVRALAHDVIVLQHGKVVERGTTQQVLTSPQHPYTRTLIEASSLASLAAFASLASGASALSGADTTGAPPPSVTGAVATGTVLSFDVMRQ